MAPQKMKMESSSMKLEQSNSYFFKSVLPPVSRRSSNTNNKARYKVAVLKIGKA